MGFVAGVVLVLAVTWLAVLGAPNVDQERIEKFARARGLPLTTQNVGVVATHLTVLRLWRRAGLVLGAASGVIAFLSQGRLGVSFTVMLLGWFVGAAVGEWQVMQPARGAVRVAGLDRRNVATYLPLVSRVVLALALGVLGLTGVAAVIDTLRTGHGSVGFWVLLVGTVLGLALLVLAMRRVVDRRRPSADASVSDADTLLRRCSVASLAGCAIALSSWPIGGFMTVLLPDEPGLPLLGAVVLGVLGWTIADHVPQQRPRTAPAAVTPAC